MVPENLDHDYIPFRMGDMVLHDGHLGIHDRRRKLLDFDRENSFLSCRLACKDPHGNRQDGRVIEGVRDFWNRVVRDCRFLLGKGAVPWLVARLLFVEGDPAGKWWLDTQLADLLV